MLSEPSKHQIVWEHIMFSGKYLTEMSRLQALSRAYRGHRITKFWYVMGIMECFRDDHGMDWCDEPYALTKLAALLVK